jgi:threonine dehydrogenase-like Zn-dependent dehydrogenase
MRAAVITAPGQVAIQEVELQEPAAGQVRLRLEGCGLCASNIPVWEGREWFSYPVEAGNPGHEGWGIVDAVGEGVTNVVGGDRVAALSYKSYAEYDLADADKVVKLPAALADKPFPGEPLGCAMNIFRRSDIQAGQTVAILGIGFLGALLVQLAKHAGARVIAVSQRDFSLDVAKENGADEVIKMDDHYRIIEDVKRLTDGKFCERVIECTGKEWPLNLAGELCAERGRLIIAGFHQDGMRQVNIQLWNWRGLDVINAHERDPQEYIRGIRDAVAAVEQGVLRPDALYTHHYPLDDMQQAFDALKNRPDGFMKALISF